MRRMKKGICVWMAVDGASVVLARVCILARHSTVPKYTNISIYVYIRDPISNADQKSEPKKQSRKKRRRRSFVLKNKATFNKLQTQDVYIHHHRRYFKVAFIFTAHQQPVRDAVCSA